MKNLKNINNKTMMLMAKELGTKYSISEEKVLKYFRNRAIQELKHGEDNN